MPFATDAGRAVGASGAGSAIHTAQALFCTSHRRLPLRASQGDDLSQFPRYNNADDDSVFEGAPVYGRGAVEHGGPERTSSGG